MQTLSSLRLLEIPRAELPLANETIYEPSPSEQREGVVEEEENLEEAGSLPPPITLRERADLRVRRGSVSDSVRQRVQNIQWFWSFKSKKIWASFIGPRRKLSKVIHALKHSRHLRYGLKNAIGIAMLSLPAFLPGDKGGGYKLNMICNFPLIAIG